tara:strand:+ start:10050 stop:10685 length:636 start_codon:yes stop_codon:yes gene_type:complete
MKKSFYLVRHGQTNWNRDGIIQGAVNEDSVLTELGISQAHALGKHFSKIVDKVTLICSDLQRSIQTTTILQQYLPNARVIMSPSLRERSLGLMQGLKQKELGFEWSNDYYYRENELYKWETLAKVKERMKFLELNLQALRGDIILVGHNWQQSYLLNILTKQHTNFVGLKNCSYHKLDYYMDEFIAEQDKVKVKEVEELEIVNEEVTSKTA